MPSFEAIRDRLPTLWRPEDDDAAPGALPLFPDDIVSIDISGGEAQPQLGVSGRTVLVTLEEAARLRTVRLLPGRAPGTGYALAVFTLLDGQPAKTPSVVVAIDHDTAQVTALFEHPEFGLQLRRRTPLVALLLATGEAVDMADLDAGDVMRAHWFAYADRALYSRFYNRRRQLAGLTPAAPGDEDLDTFPYIADLGRIAALLGVTPWKEMPRPGELVEPFRRRVARFAALYERGLGTVGALERMTTIQLPTERGPLERLDRGLLVEECAPLTLDAVDVTSWGERPDLVAPLMHWEVVNDGVTAVAPTIYVTGVDGTQPDLGPTTDPEIELYAIGSTAARKAIGWRGTVTPGSTLRLRPAFCSLAAGGKAISRADALPGDESPADPTVPGPWTAMDGSPGGTVALEQTRDGRIWAVVATEGDDPVGEVWRYDGVTWSSAVTDLAVPHCLVEDGDDLFVGTDAGLFRVAQHRRGDKFAAEASAAVTVAVLAVATGADGEWWLGTAEGLLRVDAAGAATPFGLGADPATKTAVHAIDVGAGELLLGTDLGLFQYQPGTGHWYWYRGRREHEADPDWVRFDPATAGAQHTFPAAGDVFLPPVTAVHRGPDGAIWLGTNAGIARYASHPLAEVRASAGLTFETYLEAFPDLTRGAVTSIRRDARGQVWFCTDRGLLRADRRDFWQEQAGGAAQLGRIDTLYPASATQPRGAWRYQRGADAWQHLEGPDWTAAADDLRTSDESAVIDIVWADSAWADMLTGFDPGSRTFTSTTGVDQADLFARFKPEVTRITDGGIPAIPRLPAREPDGQPARSTWRYLSREPDELKEPEQRPAWTIEGRLLPETPPRAELEPPEPGRFDDTPPEDPGGAFERGVFAYPFAAKVRFEWHPGRLLSVAVRLRRATPEETLDPVVFDRVWDGIQRVRPAGVRAVLALEEDIVRRE